MLTKLPHRAVNRAEGLDERGPELATREASTTRLSQAVFDELLAARAPCECCRRHAAQYVTEVDDALFLVCALCLPPPPLEAA